MDDQARRHESHPVRVAQSFCHEPAQESEVTAPGEVLARRLFQNRLDELPLTPALEAPLHRAGEPLARVGEEPFELRELGGGGGVGGELLELTPGLGGALEEELEQPFLERAHARCSPRFESLAGVSARASAPRSRRTAWNMRDFTVPTGMSRMPAISA